MTDPEAYFKIYPYVVKYTLYDVRRKRVGVDVGGPTGDRTVRGLVTALIRGDPEGQVLKIGPLPYWLESLRADLQR